jgi:chromosome transmission fidelity protein 1
MTSLGEIDNHAVKSVEGENGTQREKMEVVERGERNFHHPFTPYAIQERFMETVYEIIEGGGGRVGILESPTGTVSARDFIFGFMGRLKEGVLCSH